MLAEQARVLADLRLGVEAAAGVVEIHLALCVEAPVLGRAQAVELARRRVLRVSLAEAVECGHFGAAGACGSAGAAGAGAGTTMPGASGMSSTALTPFTQ